MQYYCDYYEGLDDNIIITTNGTDTLILKFKIKYKEGSTQEYEIETFKFLRDVNDDELLDLFDYSHKLLMDYKYH